MDYMQMKDVLQNVVTNYFDMYDRNEAIVNLNAFGIQPHQLVNDFGIEKKDVDNALKEQGGYDEVELDAYSVNNVLDGEIMTWFDIPENNMDSFIRDNQKVYIALKETYNAEINATMDEAYDCAAELVLNNVMSKYSDDFKISDVK